MSKIIYPNTTQSSFEDFLNEIEKFYKDKYQKTFREWSEQIQDANKHSSTNDGISTVFCILMTVMGIAAFVLWLGFFLLGMPLLTPIIASVVFAICIPLEIVFSKKQDHWYNIAEEYKGKKQELVDKICSELDEIEVYVGENAVKGSLYSDEPFYVESCRNKCYKAFKVMDKIKDEEDVRVDEIIADDNIVFNVYINNVAFETHSFGTPTNRTYFDILTRKAEDNIFDFTYLDEAQHKREEVFEEIKRR